MSDLPHMLTRMPQINDLYRSGKVLLGQIPNPGGPITQDDDLLRGRLPLLAGAVVEQGAKLFGATAPGHVDLLLGGIHQHPWTSEERCGPRAAIKTAPTLISR